MYNLVMKVNLIEFVKVYQSSKSLQEVVKRLGMKAPAVRSRAYNCRKHRVVLKHFGYAPVDWEAVKAAAAAGGK